MRLRIVLSVLILICAASVHAQVYKCTGPGGKVVYADSPCGKGGQLDEATLRANTLPAGPPAGPATSRGAPPAATEAAAAGAIAQQVRCPTDADIRSMETSLSSISLRDKPKEKRFLEAELRRARACAKEGGNYSSADWQRIRDAQADQSRIDSSDRQRARESAEGIHATSASDREQQRMQTDKQVEAERDAKRRLVVVANCDAGGCWDNAGVRYNRAGPNFVRSSDGAACRQIGTQLQCR